jgi:hypothetical protein
MGSTAFIAIAVVALVCYTRMTRLESCTAKHRSSGGGNFGSCSNPDAGGDGWSLFSRLDSDSSGSDESAASDLWR